MKILCLYLLTSFRSFNLRTSFLTISSNNWQKIILSHIKIYRTYEKVQKLVYLLGYFENLALILFYCFTNSSIFKTTLVHKKNNFCKNLGKFLQSIQFLQNSCTKYILQNSCNNLAAIFRFLQKFCKNCVSCKKCNFCKNLARSCKK